MTAISIVHNSSNSTMIVTTELKSNKSFKLHIPYPSVPNVPTIYADSFVISVYSSTFHATQFIPVIAYCSYQRFYGSTEPTVPNVTLIQPLLSLHILHFIQFPQLLKLLMFLQFFPPQTPCVYYRHLDNTVSMVTYIQQHLHLD